MEKIKTVKWNRTLPLGVSKYKHYNSFGKLVKENITDETTSLIANGNILPVFYFCDNFQREYNVLPHGTYIGGYFYKLPVIIDNGLPENTCYLCKQEQDILSILDVEILTRVDTYFGEAETPEELKK